LVLATKDAAVLNADRGEGEDRAKVGGPAHLGVGVRSDALVDPSLDTQVPVGGVDPGHVVAQGSVHQGERRHESQELERPGEYGTHIRSEPLRVQKGEDEIAQEGDGHDQADDVLGGHSLATPLATIATTANTAIVVTTKATSAIVGSCMGSELLGFGR
jgi:hypothetical protein